MPATDAVSRAGMRWPAIVVVVLLAVLAGAITVWTRLVPDSLRTAHQHDTVKLSGPAAAIRVDAIPGWQVTEQSDSTLRLRHRGDTVTVDALAVATPTPTLSTMFRRQARSLIRQQVTATEEATQHTSHGYRGVNGTAVGNGQLGRLSVLRNGDRAVSVLVLASPDRLNGYRPQLTALYDSITGAAT